MGTTIELTKIKIINSSCSMPPPFVFNSCIPSSFHPRLFCYISDVCASADIIYDSVGWLLFERGQHEDKLVSRVKIMQVTVTCRSVDEMKFKMCSINVNILYRRDFYMLSCFPLHRFGANQQPMASNYLVPVGQTTMAQVRPGPPPSAINCRPPPGPPPIPPPQFAQQQTYSSVPSMVPIRASPNITYGSLYPSRPVGGTVGGYMAYNVSMGGQPMYQQGQPVGQIMRQEPPSPVSPSTQMVPNTSPVEPQRERHLSGPPVYSSVYMQNQAETYAPPPPPPPTPSPDPNNYTPQPLHGANAYSSTTPPPPSPTNYAPPPSPVQRERHHSQPSMSMTYQQQQGGQTVSRMSTNYLASSHPYGTGMKNLTMSASAPLEQQIGFKRDPSFPLTDIEKRKINR